MGVPVLVWHAPWSEGSFGESYPFFIKSPAQAYAFVNEFVKDYAGMYAKFAAWHRDWFVPTYTSRVLEGSLYKLLPEFVRAPATQDVGMLAKNKIVSLLDERGGDEFVLFDLVEQLGETGELDGLADKVREGDSGKRSLIFSTPWNEYRYALRACFGWEDASTVTGHLKRLTARRD